MGEQTGLLFPHGVLSGNDVLIDMLKDNRRRLGRLVEVVGDDCLHWNHEPGANSMAVTLFHMGRFFDVCYTQHALGAPSDEECWISGGWAQRTGYDPRGIGRDGWGSVNEYTAEEVAAIPRLSCEQLLGYLGEVYDTVAKYLGETPMEQLAEPGAGFDGKYTRYQIINMALMDNVRHLGELYTIRSMWNRRHTS